MKSLKRLAYWATMLSALSVIGYGLARIKTAPCTNAAPWATAWECLVYRH